MSRITAKTHCHIAAVFTAALLAVSPATGQEPLRNAHAHNDYEHPRPLSDAIEHGFISIEADVHLVGDTLFVAHDLEDIQPGRTLEALYLTPILERVRSNGGTVYAGGRSLILLIDIKSDAESTYHVLRGVLDDYADMLTQFTRDNVIEGAVTAIVSGNRPRATMMGETHRLAAYDGRLADLTAHSEAPPASIPLISSHWSAISAWRGEGPMPETDRERLRHAVAKAHEQGRMLRFWGTPDTPSVWEVLLEEGVDLIGTDDLGALRDFLTSAEPK